MKEWFTNHPKHYIVNTKYYEEFNIRFNILEWVENNTVGDSTANFNINKKLFGMKWYFDNKSDAALFKLIWG
jgi:hypothetical protein